MNDPSGQGNPLQGLLGDLLKMIGGAGQGGGTPWLDAAKALAHGVATDGSPEVNPDPIQRIALEELSRVAEMHVAEATGLPVGSGQHPLAFLPVSRGTWALRALDTWTPLLEKTVAAQSAAAGPSRNQGDDTAGSGGSGGSGGHGGLEGLGGLGALGGLEGLGGLGGLGGLEGLGGSGGLEDLLGQLASTMGPVLLGMQFGSAAGHLAQRALGQYALPIPWPQSDELLVIPQNIARFAEDWSLPEDETRLWVCIRELTSHAVLSRPHVAERIGTLLEEAATTAVATHQGLADRLGDEGGDIESLQSLLSDPESLLADLLSPGQRRSSEQLIAVTTVLGAYVDHVTASVAGALIGSPGALTEAWYRYRIEDTTGEQAAGALFGLDLGREQVDRGASFVRGVVDRAGEEGLARLWSVARNLPTPAEVDAPGLWLERISLPDE